MFYVPWRLQNPKARVKPRGPNDFLARRFNVSIDDNAFSVTMPRHRSMDGNPKVSPWSKYSTSTVDYDVGSEKYESWRVKVLLSRGWDFYGPNFTGDLGYVGCTISLMSPRELLYPKDQNAHNHVSLYHPRAFEAYIGDLLKVHYSDFDEQKEKQKWFAPVNWKPITQFGCPAVIFDVAPNRWAEFSDRFYRKLILPVSNLYLLNCSLVITRGGLIDHENGKQIKNIDDYIDFTPMIEFANKILQSFSYTMGPQSIEDMRKAQENLEDTSLCDTYPPFNWTDESADMPVPNIPLEKPKLAYGKNS